jgi:APA family basic amino acid/polyamine antiporter
VVAGRAPPAAEIFSRLHSTYRTPWFTIIFFSALAVLLIAYGNINVLGNLYSFGAMLSFTTAHAAVVALRIKDPDRERPTGCPGASDPRSRDPDDGGHRRHRHLPRMGRGGRAAPEAKYVGIPWMVVGMVGYFYYRKRQGLSPRKSYRIERPERPPDFQELDYRTALVPIFGGDVSASALSARPS